MLNFLLKLKQQLLTQKKHSRVLDLLENRLQVTSVVNRHYTNRINCHAYCHLQSLKLCGKGMQDTAVLFMSRYTKVKYTMHYIITASDRLFTPDNATNIHIRMTDNHLNLIITRSWAHTYEKMITQIQHSQQIMSHYEYWKCSWTWMLIPSPLITCKLCLTPQERKGNAIYFFCITDSKTNKDSRGLSNYS